MIGIDDRHIPPISRHKAAEELEAIFEIYNPAKVGSVASMLMPYQGREEEAVMRWQQKYGAWIDNRWIIVSAP